MSLLTIIIPVYNAEKYITKAIESAASQGISDYELIIINDGSTDRTLELCRRAVEKDPRVHIFTQDNKGASAARNFGISKATGQYVAFLDADDQLVSNCFAAVEQFLINEEYDVFMFSSLGSNVDRNRYRVDMQFPDRTVPGGVWLSVNGHFGACLYRREFLLEKEIYFAEGVRLNEDQVFKLKALYCADAIRTLSGFSYIYNATPGSVMKTIDREADRVDAWQEAKRWFEAKGYARDHRLMEYVEVKIHSRMLLYAKSFIQSGHGKKQLFAELERIGALPKLYEIGPKQVMPYQAQELQWFQSDLRKFVWNARLEGAKISVGRLALRVPVVRRWRDRRGYTIKSKPE